MIDLKDFVPEDKNKKDDTFLKFFEKIQNEDPTKHIKKNEPVDTKFLHDLTALRPPIK